MQTSNHGVRNDTKTNQIKKKKNKVSTFQEQQQYGAMLFEELWV